MIAGRRYTHSSMSCPRSGERQPGSRVQGRKSQGGDGIHRRPDAFQRGRHVRRVGLVGDPAARSETQRRGFRAPTRHGDEVHVQFAVGEAPGRSPGCARFRPPMPRSLPVPQNAPAFARCSRIWSSGRNLHAD
jgi:hypothetical protein